MSGARPWLTWRHAWPGALRARGAIAARDALVARGDERLPALVRNVGTLKVRWRRRMRRSPRWRRGHEARGNRIRGCAR